MGTWVLENSLLTAFVMLVVFILCRSYRQRPALCHFLWVLAFLSLVMPPIPVASAPGTLLRSELTAWLQTGTPEVAPVVSAPELEPSLAPLAESVSPVLGTHSSPPARVAAQRTGRVESALGALASISLFEWVSGLWLIGALVFLGESVRRILAFHRRVRRAPNAGAELRMAIEEVAARMGVSTPPIRLLEGVGSPAIWCFGKPVLLWPAEDGQAVRHVGDSALIAHELAHLARGDHWVSRLDVLAIGACWWNPLFWVIRREIRYYAELSCDAWALWAFPTRRRVFAEALIDAQERTQVAPIALQGLCATNSEFKNFERRLSMIMSKNVSRQVSKGAAAAALLTTLLVLPGFSVQEKCDTLTKSAKDATTSRCIDELVEVKKLNEVGEKLFAAKRYDEAIEAFDKVLALDPKQGMAHARLGYMLITRGEYDRAKKHFKTEVKLGHKPETAIYNLACATALSGDQKQALALLEQSVRRGFTNTKLMAEDSDLASLRKHEHFARALEASKTSAELRAKLGKGKAKSKSDDESYDRLALLEPLVEIVTEDGALQDEYGLLALRMGDYEGALRAFERQAGVGHQVGRAHYNTACAHALSGHREAALKALESAADSGMAYGDTLVDEDLASLRGEKRFQAVAERLLAPKIFQKKLDSVISSGDSEQAAKTLAGLMDDPGKTAKTRAWAAYELGRLQLKSKRPKDSIVSFRQAAATGYAVEDAAFHIGMAYVSLGDLDAGVEHFDKALYLGFAKPDDMAKAVELCGLTGTDDGKKLIKRAKSQAYEGEKKKQAKKKAASEWGTDAKPSKKKPKVDSMRQP